MTITVAIDSFKGSLTTFEAGESAKEGILRAFPNARVFVRPMADGGEGTFDALNAALGGKIVNVQVTGPLGNTVNAQYGIAGNTAIMEMAQASGITLVPRHQLDPLRATTYGVGEMILDALSRSCRSFIIGIGGSATNDGGMGMLQALGAKFIDSFGNLLPARADSLKDIAKIDTSSMHPALSQCDFRIACDVKNPLCADNGCSAVFGPQKGLKTKDIQLMDGWLRSYSGIVQSINPAADPDYPGAGAAGGLGFAFLSFFNAQLISGIDLVIEVTRLEKYIKRSDLVITGEGRLDSQSCMGKAPSGVARLASKYNVPCVALSGAVTKDAGINNNHGISAFFPIVRGVCTLEDAMNTDNAKANLADTAEQVARLIKAVNI